jgi:UDP-3-O-[3-hydroxymyristoyl] glucosamine N-acyltransferase
MMKKPTKPINIDEILEAIADSCKVLGKRDRYISTVAPIGEAGSESLTFCNEKGGSGLKKVRESGAGVVICYDCQFTEADHKDKTLILAPDPRLAFMRVMRRYFWEAVAPSISPQATIDQGAVIHPSTHIGPNSYIGKCEIGENTVIYGNVYLYPGVVIGRNVVIHAGAVIGSEGQGFHRNQKRELEKFPQIGGVVIEDDVEIGSNASIMRGAMGNTIIGRGTKLGHLCNIGHNVIVGKHCLIVTASVLGGGSQIGDYSQISLGACIRNGVKVGQNAFVGMGAVVTKDVGEGKLAYGVPAVEHGDAPRASR